MTSLATNGVTYNLGVLYSPFRTTQSPVPGFVRSEEPLTEDDFRNRPEVREEYVRYKSDLNVQASLVVAGSLQANTINPGLQSILSNPPFDIFNSQLDAKDSSNALIATQLYTSQQANNPSRGSLVNALIPVGIPASTADTVPSTYQPDLRARYNNYLPNPFTPNSRVEVVV